MKKIPFIVLCISVFVSCKKSSDNTTQPATTVAVVPNTYTDLLNFNGTNGNSPWGDLIISGNVLYGMTAQGGTAGDGNIFSINTNGTGYKDLHDFAGGSADGAGPGGDLTLYGNVLYGMTRGGGSQNGGVIFSINPDGSGYKTIYSFNYASGSEPNGSLTIAGGMMYGMTQTGGTNYDGVVFSIQTNGTGYTDLLDFNDANGSQPLGSLVLSGNTLYGMTFNGGSIGYGVIFSISTNGSGYSLLQSFTGTNGSNPRGTLALSGNTLFGMTFGGATQGGIFSIHTDGSNFKNLLVFDSASGSEPYGSLLLSGSKVYAMTSNGGQGTASQGVMFSVDTNGSGYNTLHTFDNTATGANPYGALILSNNILYGMTIMGGTYNYGVIFSYSL